MRRAWGRLARVLAVMAVMAIAAAPVARAITIEEVKSPGGITAWLVEDHSLPVVTIDVSFRGGAALDPAGKDGLASLVCDLLDEGAGDLDSERLSGPARRSRARISSFAAGDDTTGAVAAHRHGECRAGLRSVAARADGAALRCGGGGAGEGPGHRRARPRRAAAARHRRAPVAQGRVRRSPLCAARRRHRRDGRAPSPPMICAASSTTRLAKDVMLVAVVGDIAPDALKTLLDQTFGALPAHAGAGRGAAAPRQRPRRAAARAARHSAERRRVRPARPQARRSRLVRGASRQRHPRRRRLQRAPDPGSAREARSRLFGLQRARSDGRRAASSSAASPPRTRASPSRSTSSAPSGSACATRDRPPRNSPTPRPISPAPSRSTSIRPGASPPCWWRCSATASASTIIDRRSALIDGVTLDEAKRVAARLLDPAALTFVVVGSPGDLKGARVGRPPAGADPGSPSARARPGAQWAAHDHPPASARHRQPHRRGRGGGAPGRGGQGAGRERDRRRRHAAST